MREKHNGVSVRNVMSIMGRVESRFYPYPSSSNRTCSSSAHCFPMYFNTSTLYPNAGISEI